MIKTLLGLIAGALTVGGMCRAEASVRLCELFSDHMVLQRGVEVPVWGNAAPKEKVSVQFGDVRLSTVAGTKGAWEVRLPAMRESITPRQLVVRCAEERVVVKDVLVGDVWLVSGQSNAEMNFSWGILDGEVEMAKSRDYPNIRVVKFRHARSVLPEVFPCCDKWVVADKMTLPGITAEGYFMARELNAKTGVPIGLLENCWSGSSIDPFIPYESLCCVSELAGLLGTARYTRNRILTSWGPGRLKKEQDLCIAWCRELESRRARGEVNTMVPDGLISFNAYVCGQYNAMIAPIVRFPIAGATWYQGCTNAGEGLAYRHKLRAMISGWRKAWGTDFPFYIVQLSSFTDKTSDPAGGDGFAAIREAQRLVAQTVPKCGLAVTIDIGNAKDIHPKNKLDVGTRLAKWALRDVCGRKDVVVSGPLFKSASIEGDRIRVSFEHVGSGLMIGDKGPNAPGEMPTAAPKGKLRGFAISGADKKWHWAEAVIDGSDVVVCAAEVKAPVAVRYAYRGNPMGDCNLYNREGLPASPFNSENEQ